MLRFHFTADTSASGIALTWLLTDHKFTGLRTASGDQPLPLIGRHDDRLWTIDSAGDVGALAAHVDVDADLPPNLAATLQAGLAAALQELVGDRLHVTYKAGDEGVEVLPDLVCSKCGGAVPQPTDEMRRLAATEGVALVIDHDVCPDAAPPAPRRRFVVDVTISELDGDSEDRGEPFFVFTHTVEADDLEAAMRPLAEGLGQKWMLAEKQARIADDAAAAGGGA